MSQYIMIIILSFKPSVGKSMSVLREIYYCKLKNIYFLTGSNTRHRSDVPGFEFLKNFVNSCIEIAQLLKCDRG